MSSIRYFNLGNPHLIGALFTFIFGTNLLDIQKLIITIALDYMFQVSTKITTPFVVTNFICVTKATEENFHAERKQD